MKNSIVKLLKSIREIYREFNPFLLTRFDRYFIKANIPGYPKNTKFADLPSAEVVIFIQCKNNYNFFIDLLLPYCLANFSNFACIVIDDGSELDNKDLLLAHADQRNILLMDNDGVGFQYGLQTVCRILNDNRLRNKIIFQMSHDYYPVINDPSERILDTANFMLKNSIQICGLNTLDYRQARDEIRNFKNGKLALGLLGRRLLHKGDGGWIRRDAIVPIDENARYFEIEAAVDMCVLINADLVHCKWSPSKDFWLYCWLDDIAMEVLKGNGTIIVDTSLVGFHCQELKRRYKIPVSSVDGAKRNDKRFGRYDGHLEAWIAKWGFCRLTKRGVTSAAHKFVNTKIFEMVGRRGVLKVYE